MAACARYVSLENTRRWQDSKFALTAKAAHILHLSEQTKPQHA
jgi:hypothetical protein